MHIDCAGVPQEHHLSVAYLNKIVQYRASLVLSSFASWQGMHSIIIATTLSHDTKCHLLGKDLYEEVRCTPLRRGEASLLCFLSICRICAPWVRVPRVRGDVGPVDRIHYCIATRHQPVPVQSFITSHVAVYVSAHHWRHTAPAINTLQVLTLNDPMGTIVNECGAASRPVKHNDLNKTRNVTKICLVRRGIYS